jgi:hypothetical protein
VGVTTERDEIEMTAAEMAKMIGKPAQLDVGGMTFLVTIVDVRNRFGSVDYLVTPQAGHGEQWKSADGVRTN